VSTTEPVYDRLHQHARGAQAAARVELRHSHAAHVTLQPQARAQAAAMKSRNAGLQARQGDRRVIEGSVGGQVQLCARDVKLWLHGGASWMACCVHCLRMHTHAPTQGHSLAAPAVLSQLRA
jgi:hypothetical protein